MKLFSKYKYAVLGMALVFVLGAFVFSAAPALADTFGINEVGDTGLGTDDIRVTIGKIIRAALGLLGVVAVGIIIYGGFVYMTAGGNEENVGRARKIIVNGVIGLTIIFSAMTITQFVLSKLSEATGSGFTSGNGGCTGTYEECNTDLNFGSCTEQFFVTKSITPSQDETGMNNIVVRVVFSKSVATDVNNIITIERGAQTINERFDFSFVEGTDKKVLEAHYNQQDNCEETNYVEGHECIPVSENEYKVTLNENVVSESGEKVNDDVNCSGFEPVTGVDFEVNKQANDVGVPSISPITFITPNGELSGDGQTLFAGTTYPIQTTVTDANGVGYVHLRVETEDGTIVLNTYNGPEKNNSDKPYEFQHNLVIPGSVEAKTKYTVSVSAYDIDHNVEQASTFFYITPPHCDNGLFDEDKGETSVDAGGPCGFPEGDSCVVTADCALGNVCLEGICVSHPEIMEISPQDGDSGNWISIIGKGFGNSTGVVEFAEYEYANTDEVTWIPAPVVQCNVVDNSWTNNYAVVEVPEGLSEYSAIRIRRAIDNLEDSTVDSYGVKPLPKDPVLLQKFKDENIPAGAFLKVNGLERPGLCAVVNNSGSPEGLAGTAVVADGKSFGGTQGNSFLDFGGVATSIDSWSDIAIKSSVPGNILPGKPAVQVNVDGKKSNKVLFTVVGGDDEDVQPLVTQVTPETPTKGSFVSITGKNFGETLGLVHLLPNENANCPTDAGCKLLSFDLPDFCGDTWSGTEIVGKVPDSVEISEYHIVVERAAGLQSKVTHSINVVAGDSQPGICKLEPVAGPAPLPPENVTGLRVRGINFSEDPTVYFWRQGAIEDQLSSWLSSKKDDFLPGQDIVINNDGDINTFIPVSIADGQSMQSGHIKVESSNGVVSNGISYKVSDCRIDGADIPGYRCCAEGPGAGQWVEESYICPGEEVSSGYAWRFTTGLIPDLPHVVEQCNVDDWNDDNATIEMPSPVPSVQWPSGENACVNANIEVALNVGLDKGSILGPDNQSNTSDDNIKVYKCGTGSEIDCGEYDSVVSGLDIGAYDESQTLTIFDANNKELEPNTWYRVVLNDAINSVPLSVGQNATEVRPLRVDKPLTDLDGVAYHYDFKTSEEVCFLQKAFIVPPTKTTHILGLLTNPWDDSPFYYRLKGKANQVCTLVSVDGKGWVWNTNPPAKAIATKAPLKNDEGEFVIEDSRATVEAVSNAPDGVQISALIPNAGEGFNGAFEAIGGIANTYTFFKDVKIISSENIADFDLTKPFSLEYKVEFKDDFTPLSRRLVYRKNQFTIEVKPDKRVCLTVPPEPTIDGPSLVSACSNPIVPLSGTAQHFVWTWDGANLKMFDKNGLLSSKPLLKVPESSEDLYIGAEPSKFPLKHTLVSLGLLPDLAIKNAHAISHLNGGQNINFFAQESTLYIDLFDPEVIYFEPNCSESCVNANIRVDFNRDMGTGTYAEGFRVHECTDGPNCKTLAPTSAYTIDQDSSTPTSLRATIEGATKLKPNTWYKVSLNGQFPGENLTDAIQSLGKVDDDPNNPSGKFLPTHEWSFRTQNDSTPCAVNRLEISPDPFTMHFVGQKTIYTAIPFSSPNACSKSGQILNKWDYGYDWSTQNPEVATVSNFDTSFGWKPQCTFQCLRSGSDVPLKENGSVNDASMCGNGVIEVGEDCEISNNVNGQPNIEKNACGLNCLYTPDKVAELGLNGSDPLPLDNVQLGVSYCGDGVVGEGEACDIAIDENGCTDTCLHTGSALSAGWCETEANNDQKSSTQCDRSVSVCGNNVLELSEECEVGEVIDGVSVTNDMCSSECLLQNLCNTPLAECSPDNYFCNQDCTLAGSSLLYPTPSLCGDGAVGPGEDNACEILVSNADAVDGAAPSQIATAIGEGDSVNGTQTTVVETNIHGLPGIGGDADLTLQCGYTEFINPDSVGDYNDCQQNSTNELGVANNSCCRPRPVRTSEYPAANQGLTPETEPVCRNSYIEVEFAGKEMLLDSLKVATPNVADAENVTEEDSEELKNLLEANLMVVIGYKEGYICAENNGIDVTSEVNAIAGIAQAEEPGFWKNIWNKVKSFFAGIVEVVFAAGEEATTLAEASVWCATQIPVDVDITYKDVLGAVDADGNQADLGTDTIISVYIKKLLKSNTVHGVFLRGGQGGIRDVFGVGIKSPNSTDRDDAWFFKTGEEVCKISNVTANPDSALYNAPETEKTFQAYASNENAQLLTPIDGVYDWDWAWKPINAVFDIPNVNEPTNIISSKNVEGSITGVVQAEITADISEENKQLPGTAFGAHIDLTALFCENPWPAYNADQSWDAYKNDTYNFSFSYCADAGLSGNIIDDLPVLKEPLSLESDDKIGQCEETGDACGSSNDCPQKVIFAKAGEVAVDFTYNYDKTKTGTCAYYTDDTFSSYVIHGGFNDDEEPVMCSVDSDCNTTSIFVNAQKSETINASNLGDAVFCNTSQPFEVEQLQCQTGILEKSLFLNNSNQDGFGLQIFKNQNGLSIRDWYTNQFGTLGSMQPTNVGGYDALTDGTNYYVSALNFVQEEGQIYHNVFLFSVNEQAAGSTAQVLNKILESLEFNTNLTDHGLCLEFGVPSGPEGVRNHADSVTEISCSNDFQCIGDDGNALPGTNGTCSNAKTKFFRDWQRVHDIQTAQSKLDAYFANTTGLPSFAADFDAGSFVTGYTNSRWSVSWSALSGLIDGVGIDPVNQWSKCGVGSGVSQQTCWDATDAVYHCPTASQVYEYEYDEDLDSYTIHAPLEFFKTTDNVTQSFVDSTKHTTEPWCTGKGLGFSPADEICGNGIVGPSEVCDPAGKIILGNYGMTQGSPGVCNYPFDSSNQCLSEADCNFITFDSGENHVVTNVFDVEQGVCAKGESETEYYPVFEKIDGKNDTIGLFPCSSQSQCQSSNIYEGKQLYSMSDTDQPISESPDQSYECIPLDKTLVGEEYTYESASCNGLVGENNPGNCEYTNNSCTSNTDCGLFKQPSGTNYEVVGYPTHACAFSEKWEYGTWSPRVFAEASTFNEQENIGIAYHSCNPSAGVDLCNDPSTFFEKGIRTQLHDGTPITLTSEQEIVEFLEINPAGCINSVFSTFYNQPQEQCLGSAPGSPVAGECGIGEIASNVCNATCTGIDYGSCKSVSSCGNGLVETTEVCDDGALNGTYGHCSADCKVTNSGSYCGDGVFDAENEFCDWSHPDWDHGPVYAGQTKFYNPNEQHSCSWDCQAVGSFCGDGIVQEAEGEQCDDGNTNDNDVCDSSCQETAYVCKEAALSVEIDEEYSDSGFPATNIVIGTDSNTVEECLPYTQEEICAAFETEECLSLYHDLEDGYAANAGCFGFGKEPLESYIKDSYEELIIICKGISPAAVQAEASGVKDPDTCGNGVAETYQKDGEEIIEVCDKGDQNGQACNPAYGESCTFCSADCREVLTADSAGYCGDGSINAIGTTTDEDGNVISTQLETCDYKSDGTVVKYSSQSNSVEDLYCPDKGNYECVDSCTAIVNNCISCGYTGSEGVTPKFSILNPVIASGENWPSNFGAVELYKKTNNLDAKWTDQNELLGSDFGFNLSQNPWKSIFYSPTAGAPNFSKINQDLSCSDLYYVGIGLSQYAEKVDTTHEELIENGFTSLFPFTVTGDEEAQLQHEYIASPPVPPEAFRVVFTWDKTNSELDGVEFNSEFYDPAGSVQHISYTRALNEGGLCRVFEKRLFEDSTSVQFNSIDEDEYWWYPEYKPGNDICWPYSDRIRVHDEVVGDTMGMQSFTVETDDFEYWDDAEIFIYDENVEHKGNYGFLVQTINGNPIAQFADTNLKVHVYTHKEGQDSLLSYIEPEFTFNISDTLGSSTLSSSKYWHAFNLQYDYGTSKYEVVPVNTIEANTCQVKANIPGVPGCDF